jgi:hypothetical protein
VEKGPIGLGKRPQHDHRRSNYMLPSNTRFYEKSLKLWRGSNRISAQRHDEPARRPPFSIPTPNRISP